MFLQDLVFWLKFSWMLLEATGLFGSFWQVSSRHPELTAPESVRAFLLCGASGLFLLPWPLFLLPQPLFAPCWPLEKKERLLLFGRALENRKLYFCCDWTPAFLTKVSFYQNCTSYSTIHCRIFVTKKHDSTI